MRKKVLVIGLLVLVCSYLIVEITLRYKFGTACSGKYDIKRIIPADYIDTDSSTGLFNIHQGQYFIEHKSGFHFTATHGLNGRSFLNSNNSKRNIYIYGDSHLYGYGLNDSATMCYMVSKKYKQMNVINKSIPGQHMGMNYIKFISDSSSFNNKTDLILFQFASFDKQRLILTPLMAHAYQSLSDKRVWISYCDTLNGRIEFKKKQAENWSLLSCYLATSYFYELYNAYTESESQKDKAKVVAQMLMRKLFDEVKKQGLNMIVVGHKVNTEDSLWLNNQIEQYPSISYLDITVRDSNPKYTLEPFDNHPSYLANRIFAERIGKAIENYDDTGKVK